MRRSWTILFVLLLPLLGSCDYERVSIYVANDLYIGRTLSHYRDVEVIGSGRQRSILLKPGARFSIQTPDVTQFVGQFEVAIREGEGMTAYLRTVPHDFDTTKGIAFRYSTEGCSVRLDDGTVIPLQYNAEREQHIISLYNEAALVAISVDCDRLFEELIDEPGTAYVIFETFPGSSVELRSVNFYETDTD